MKPTIYLRTVLAILCGFATTFAAPLEIGLAPGDGKLELPAGSGEVFIDLAQASTGAWDQPGAAPGKGVYDPLKWAVVFKYDSISIAEGVTVRFINHPSRAPVVWLVSGGGSADIQGTVILDGNGWTDNNVIPEGGPGAFRGGLTRSSGFGPGGGNNSPGQYGAGAGSYGNAQIVPLIGGSGAGPGTESSPGGAGGGAILIIARNLITIGGSGAITANGGDGTFPGSGGAIRLIADQISGQGRISAESGSPGRIRLEANSLSLRSLNINPTPSLSFTPEPLVIWPTENSPSVRVVSIGGVPAPEDPRAPLENVAPDVLVASDTVVTIVLETANFPTTGRVNVFIRPRSGESGIFQATLVSGTDDRATWQLQQPLPELEYASIQARAVAP